MKKIFLINFIITIILLLVLEWFVRFFKLSNLMGMDSSLIFKKNDNYYMVPSSSGLVFNAQVFIDKNGFRVPTKNFIYKNKKNILFIGDSVTFGNGVVEEMTFVGKLRNEFSSLNFINTSVPGHQIKNYEKKIEEFKKIKNLDKIIYVITLNDVYGSSNISNLQIEQEAQDERENSFWIKVKNNKLITVINYYLRNKSYLYMYVKGKFSDPSKRYFASIDNFYKKNQINRLYDLIIELKKINTELYIITLPYEYQTRICDENILLPQKKIKELFYSTEINYYDFTEKFCNFEKPKNLYIKYDPMHLSELGHNLVYNLIKNQINF